MDTNFVDKLQKGDESAFKDLVEIYKNQVVNTCFGFVNNYTDADDLAQEVFIEIHRSISAFNQDSKLSTWIYRIAVNKSLDFIRKNKRKKRWSELFRMDANTPEHFDNYVISRETPQMVMEQKELVSILQQAIESLPKNQKTAFNLHKYEDLSYKEIADIMETSVSSVESLMHRAKTNLKQRLEKFYKNNF